MMMNCHQLRAASCELRVEESTVRFAYSPANAYDLDREILNSQLAARSLQLFSLN